ncbi:uncharacterized protein B0I36DRAFT_365380 [Microdochium trichocladiopsis]|uniref:Uncharacterized protein n=1 Tax=Microdochium trichocladiopsis TaxID=1682393 RepID=A0A9P9BMC8_9PEZI|nr:uncharacterized protein B0I36DRAFT_365380 [Microdochium trichocladiopsis]KAH7025706.1 hypothetical protein B0I36DRAFT_365380 [Microdochium trichocladiopsis]
MYPTRRRVPLPPSGEFRADESPPDKPRSRFRDRRDAQYIFMGRTVFERKVTRRQDDFRQSAGKGKRQDGPSQQATRGRLPVHGFPPVGIDEIDATIKRVNNQKPQHHQQRQSLQEQHEQPNLTQIRPSEWNDRRAPPPWRARQQPDQRQERPPKQTHPRNYRQAGTSPPEPGYVYIHEDLQPYKIRTRDRIAAKFAKLLGRDIGTGAEYDGRYEHALNEEWNEWSDDRGRELEDGEDASCEYNDMHIDEEATQAGVREQHAKEEDADTLLSVPGGWSGATTAQNSRASSTGNSAYQNNSDADDGSRPSSSIDSRCQGSRLSLPDGLMPQPKLHRRPVPRPQTRVAPRPPPPQPGQERQQTTPRPRGQQTQQPAKRKPLWWKPDTTKPVPEAGYESPSVEENAPPEASSAVHNSEPQHDVEPIDGESVTGWNPAQFACLVLVPAILAALVFMFK